MYFVVREGGRIVLLTDSLYDGFFVKYDSRIYAGRNLLVSSEVFPSGHTEKKMNNGYSEKPCILARKE